MSIINIKNFKMVGATGLEPAASWSQTKHSTKLSYAPISIVLLSSCVTAFILYYGQNNLSTLYPTFFSQFKAFHIIDINN